MPRGRAASGPLAARSCGVPMLLSQGVFWKKCKDYVLDFWLGIIPGVFRCNDCSYSDSRQAWCYASAPETSLLRYFLSKGRPVKAFSRQGFNLILMMPFQGICSCRSDPLD